MADPTSNLNVIQADNFFLRDPVSKSHVNLQSQIVGLAPATLSTCKLARATLGTTPPSAAIWQQASSSHLPGCQTFRLAINLSCRTSRFGYMTVEECQVKFKKLPYMVINFVVYCRRKMIYDR